MIESNRDFCYVVWASKICGITANPSISIILNHFIHHWIGMKHLDVFAVLNRCNPWIFIDKTNFIQLRIDLPNYLDMFLSVYGI